ncbi:MAG: hypothetical protein IPI03_16900 [Rubrivivax sp.]|nr:hypothetical protein [Rubrivivax sp.]
MRNTVVAIGTVMNNEIGPQVRRHPVLSVSLAAAAGAALVAARPWRWQPLASRANLVQRQALDSALSWSWQQLTQPSVLAALVTGIAAWRGQAVSRADAAAAPVAPQPDLGNLQ